MRRTPLEKLKALQLADLRVQAQAERKRRIREGWERLVRRLTKRVDRMSTQAKDVAKLATAVGALYGVLRTPVGWMVRLYRARSVDRAELPSSGVASTAGDYVKTPRKQ